MLQAKYFPKSYPLPGVQALLSTLVSTQKTTSPVYMALAMLSQTKTYKMKMDHLEDLFSVFPQLQCILGDDLWIGSGWGKPLPDIYLIALESINAAIQEKGKESKIKLEKYLVFEDAVPGVEAGCRAGNWDVGDLVSTPRS